MRFTLSIVSVWLATMLIDPENRVVYLLISIASCAVYAIGTGRPRLTRCDLGMHEDTSRYSESGAIPEDLKPSRDDTPEDTEEKWRQCTTLFCRRCRRIYDVQSGAWTEERLPERFRVWPR